MIFKRKKKLKSATGITYLWPTEELVSKQRYNFVIILLCKDNFLYFIENDKVIERIKEIDWDTLREDWKEAWMAYHKNKNIMDVPKSFLDNIEKVCSGKHDFTISLAEG